MQSKGKDMTAASFDFCFKVVVPTVTSFYSTLTEQGVANKLLRDHQLSTLTVRIFDSIFQFGGKEYQVFTEKER